MTPPIRILLADDHALFREGVRLILETQLDLQVVGEAASGVAAVQQAQRLHPDVVVMDLTMPDGGGLEATETIKQELPETHVLVLTMHDDQGYFFRVLQAGASGYVVKGAQKADLLAAIRAVAAGGVYLYPTVAKQLVGDYLRQTQQGEAADQLATLTEREREVLSLIAAGHSNLSISQQLVLSQKTVEAHVGRVFARLGLEETPEYHRRVLAVLAFLRS